VLVRWNYPELSGPGMARAATTSTLPVERWVQESRRAYPDLRDVPAVFSTVPGERWRMLDVDAAILVWELQDVEGEAAPDHHLMVGVHPGTGEPVARFVYEQSWAGLPYRIHTTLLLPFGRELTAVLGVLLTISIVTGAWLWLPARGRRWPSLRPGTRKHIKVKAWDSHTLAGVVLAPIALVVFLTGAYLSAPAVVRSAVLPPAAVEWPETRASEAPACRGKLTVRESLRRVAALVPGNIPHAFYPVEDWGTVGVVTRYAGSGPARPPAPIIEFDRTCATASVVLDPPLAGWFLPVHSGEVLGPARRLLVPLVGIGLTALVVAGEMVWWYRRRPTATASAPAVP
jgi:uncharacterized iron-regulated membrane protein